VADLKLELRRMESPIMNALLCTRKRIAAVVAALGIVFTAVALLGRARGHDDAEYPDAPFQPFPADAPRLIVVRERPSDQDKEALARFQSERKQAREYIKTHGSEKNISAEERAALDALAASKYVRARESAETILRSNPGSLSAMFALAESLADGESNPAAALHQLRVLRRKLEERGRANPSDGQAREWYLRELMAEYSVLTALGRDREALRAIELIEQVYEPLPWLKTWPLLRLRQFDAAEATVAAVEQLGRWPERSLNDRASLEFQRRSTDKSLDTFRRLVALAPQNGLYWSNCAEAAWCNLRFDESEQCCLKAVKSERSESRLAYGILARLYVQQTRFSEAIDALKQGQARRAQREPYTWQFDAGDIDLTLTRLLLALGNLRDGERIARRAYDRPNRQGLSTQNETSRDLNSALTLLTVLRCRIAQAREAGSTGSWLSRLDANGRALLFESWSLERKLIKLLDDDLIMDTLRPYIAGNDGIEPWLAAELMEILPSGVAAAAIQRARGGEDRSAASPYFDAYESELALRDGRYDAAAQLADRALEKLPAEAEKLFRARVQTVAAAAALRSGRTQQCLERFDPVLDTFPSALRLLNVAIPVRIEDDGSAAAHSLAGRLARSPRLRLDPAGFRISVRHADGKLAVAMFGLGDGRHFEESTPIDGGDFQTAVTTACRSFHDRLASPAVDLSQMAINSLDGSPVAVRERNAVGAIMDRLQAQQ
jgi:hypothetical protein